MIQAKKIEKTDKEEIISEMRGMVTVLGESIEQLAQATNKGFAEVHARIDGVENGLETLGSRVDSLDKKIEDLRGDMNEKIEDLRGDMNENFGKVRNDIFVLHDNVATKEEVKKIAFRVTKLERSAI